MDGTVIACAALYPFDNSNVEGKVEGNKSAEVACVAVQEKYRDQGRAAALLKALEKDARKLSVDTVFVLTTQTAHWFIEQGFKAGYVDQLPAQKKQLYNFQRNSKVFVKHLT